MYHLINPGGRVVILDSESEFNRWKDKPGFQIPTREVIQKFETERSKMIWEMQNYDKIVIEAKKGVHLSTVSQGGKDGYAISSKLLAQELEKLKIPTKTFYAGQDIAILFHWPYSLFSLKSPYKIIYTMFESTKIPDEWINYLESANQVVVPSKWCQKVFADSGIKSTVIPLGYDQRAYKFIDRSNRPKTKFRFLHYDAFNVRKGFLELFKAFNLAFDKNEPVELVLKTTMQNPTERFPITEEIYPNIRVLEGKYSEFEMTNLMRDSDCFVFPSRGEGFGITPLEAMATGLPAIIPNAHGLTEYFDERYMYEVKVEGPTPALYTRYKDQDVGSMVVCDIEDLAKQMRYVYEHQDEAREKGFKAAQYVTRWSFENTAKMFKELIDEVKKHPIPATKIINLLPLKTV